MPAGPQALTFADAAALLSAELGRPVAYRRQLVIDLTTRLGLAKKVTDDVPRALGRPAGDLAQFIHDHCDAWRPASRPGRPPQTARRPSRP